MDFLWISRYSPLKPQREPRGHMQGQWAREPAAALSAKSRRRLTSLLGSGSVRLAFRFARNLPVLRVCLASSFSFQRPSCVARQPPVVPPPCRHHRRCPACRRTARCRRRRRRRAPVGTVAVYASYGLDFDFRFPIFKNNFEELLLH